MKISKLIEVLRKAEAKYGNIEVGAYQADFANEVGVDVNLDTIQFRVVSSIAGLPGDDLGEADTASEVGNQAIGVLFYA